MPILPSILHYITSEETQFEAPVSENLEQNMGEAINYLNDLFLNNFIEFSTPGGPFPLVVSPGVTKLLIIAAAGGGGGGGGAHTQGAGFGGGGGAGGAGSLPQKFFFKTTPGDLLNISIGLGGAGGAGSFSPPFTQPTNGANGSSTLITGPGISLILPGGGGGAKGIISDGSSSVFAASGMTSRKGLIYTDGGSSGRSPSGPLANPGETSVFSPGGSAGTSSGVALLMSGGGGGGAGFFAGGNGGNHNTNSGLSVGGISAGGGGGGGKFAASPGFPGAAGGNGFCFITWY